MIVNDIKAAMISAAIHLHNKNMLAGADGNISYRVSNDEILITPSGQAKMALSPTDMAIIDINNTILCGNPSSEMLMHTHIYQRCAEAKAVLHAHPPTAIAWTIAEPDLTFLPSDCLSELILATGGIPIAPFALPGTDDMGQSFSHYLPEYKAIILARHGAITWGETIAEAINGMERIEHTAEILMKAKLINKLSFLGTDDVATLYAMRKKIGNKLL